jgi:hypothetical protein
MILGAFSSPRLSLSNGVKIIKFRLFLHLVFSVPPLGLIIGPDPMSYTLI